MRKEFLEQEEVESLMKNKGYDKEEATTELAPWAAIFQKVEGGVMAFESIDDYNTFINQK